MKKNDSKKLRNSILTSLLCMVVGFANAQQDIYISNGEVLHYSSGDFVSKEIDNTNGGVFSISSNYVPSDVNYVKGPVTSNAAGSFTVSLGGTTGANSATARNFSFTTTGLGTAAYNETTVPSGTVTSPTGYVLANAEVYTFTGNVSAASATPLVSTTFGAATGSIVPVYSTSETGPWEDTLTPGTTTKMTFAREDTTLETNTFNLNTFKLYPNPVKANATSINFSAPNTVQQLSVTLYDITGKVVQRYNNMSVQEGVNSISKPKVAQGFYLIRFSYNNGEQQITKRIIVE